VWVHGPGHEPWEVYTVKADAPEATSLHPVGVSPDAACECGTPTGVSSAAAVKRCS
jgi:hypothetical protein